MNINKNYILVEGDVEQTIPQFLIENPGLKISLLYIDVDIERPTYAALKYLWDRILPGGVILFDEYEYHKFSESIGVDKFLHLCAFVMRMVTLPLHSFPPTKSAFEMCKGVKEFNIPYDLQSTNFIAPTAFMIKK